MTDMRVKMFLDLVNNTKGGAAQAKREMKGVKDAARDLNRQEAGKKIARDILAIANHSKGASRGLREVKGAAAGIGSDGASARLARDLEKARAAAARLRAELRGVKQQTTQAGGPAAAAGKGGTNTLLPGTRGMLGGYLGIQGARAGVRGTVGQSVSFEKAMADVVKKVDLPEGQTQADLERMITGSAIKFGRSREQIAGLAAELGAAGTAYTDLGRAIAQATRASVAWDMTPSETGETLAKIRTQHGWSLDQLDEFIDKVNALADTGASKERDIVEMFQRAAAGAKAADVGSDTTLAITTAMNAGGMAPEVSARGFGAMVSKLRTASAGANKKMAEGLKMLGLTPKGVEQGMKTNSLKTMIDLMERFDKSTDKAAVAVKMFGQEWWDEFARMVQGAPEIAKNLKLLADRPKWDGSSEKSLNIELNTTANHLERLKALASDVGDRMGRWALPPINAAIEQLISQMAAFDQRTAERQRAKDTTAADQATAEKIVSGQALTPAERERLAQDAAYRKRIQGHADDKRTDRTNISLNGGLRLSELEREREQLSTSIEARRKAGAGDDQLAFSRRRLEEIADAIGAIDPAKAPARAPRDPRRPADALERGQADRGEAAALRERMAQLESRLRAVDELRAGTTNPADRDGFTADAAAARGRRDRTRRELMAIVAPNATAAGRFGTAPGGAPAKAPTGPTGSGLTNFGLNGFKAAGDQWKEGIRTAFEIDLGDAGVTMMERIREGIEAGKGGVVGAASGLGSEVKSAVAGTDLTAAGQQAAASFAAGLRSGGPAVAAAAESLAAQARTAAASAARNKSIAGQPLHEGVT